METYFEGTTIFILSNVINSFHFYTMIIVLKKPDNYP